MTERLARLFRLLFRDSGPHRERLDEAAAELEKARHENTKATKRNKAAVETYIEELLKEVRPR